MDEFSLSVAWHLKPGETFEPGKYSQDHDWTFAGGEVVAASGAPNLGGSGARVNPEESLIASASSCHMLTFLAIAAKHDIQVISYTDAPSGIVAKGDGGIKAITTITLRPHVVFSGGEMGDEELERLHASAHKYCFIANSLKTDISVQPRHEFHR